MSQYTLYNHLPYYTLWQSLVSALIIIISCHNICHDNHFHIILLYALTVICHFIYYILTSCYITHYSNHLSHYTLWQWELYIIALSCHIIHVSNRVITLYTITMSCQMTFVITVYFIVLDCYYIYYGITHYVNDLSHLHINYELSYNISVKLCIMPMNYHVTLQQWITTLHIVMWIVKLYT